jgi:HPt (histidine-containing phosphotransfer) domain-containing protein
LERWVAGETVTSGAEPAGAAERPSTGEPSHASPLDARVVADLHGLEDRSGELSEIVAVYLQDSQDSLAAMRRACEEGDTRVIARTSHALKGSSANLGAHGVVTLAKELEALAAAGDVGAAPGVLGRLEAELQRVEEALLIEFPPPAAADPTP